MKEKECDGNGWEKWENHILAELKRQNDLISKIFDKLDRMNGDIVALKVKAGFWGVIGGGIVTVAGGIVIWLVTKN